MRKYFAFSGSFLAGLLFAATMTAETSQTRSEPICGDCEVVLAPVIDAEVGSRPSAAGPDLVCRCQQPG